MAFIDFSIFPTCAAIIFESVASLIPETMSEVSATGCEKRGILRAQRGGAGVGRRGRHRGLGRASSTGERARAREGRRRACTRRERLAWRRAKGEQQKRARGALAQRASRPSRRPSCREPPRAASRCTTVPHDPPAMVGDPVRSQCVDHDPTHFHGSKWAPPRAMPSTRPSMPDGWLHLACLLRTVCREGHHAYSSASVRQPPYPV